MYIKCYRVKEGAKIPSRSNPSDAGLDVYACLEEDVEILPSESKLIPIGFKFGIPHGFMMQAMNRSGIAAKRQLIVGAHVIDSGYNGEVFINLQNIGLTPQTIRSGDKISQLVMIPVVHTNLIVSLEDNLYSDSITMSNRGEGALGSTGG